MASEAPRSTVSSHSYMGSLISLTSKSDIRYEGILFSINPEESSIGLRNVRSFGSEGRKKDGPQVAPIDKIYEYIIFRGADIKDLQVKSIQTIQPTPLVHNDPAILQSYYPPVSLPSTSLPSATDGSVSDLSAQMSQPIISRSTFPGSLPLYQPGESFGSMDLSIPPPSNGSGLVMPMNWPRHCGTSSGLQNQQQTLLRPPQELPMPPPPLPQSIPHPISASLTTRASNLSASSLSDFPPPFLPPIGSNSLNLKSALASDASTYSMPTKGVLSTALQSPSLPMVSPLPSVLDRSVVSSLVPNQAKHVSNRTTLFNSTFVPLSAAVGTSASPSLVTPGQFLQSGTTTLSLSQTSQMTKKDAEVVRVSSSVLPPPSSSAAPAARTPVLASTEVQAPLLPLPSTSNSKISHSATNFAKDFDFGAMNEKFNKDEVWGNLGKSKAEYTDFRDTQHQDGVEFSRVEIKPVYKKDDFFDTLSCNCLDNASQSGRPTFSKQMRLNTETFGDFSRYQGGRGGRGPNRGGRSRGGYYGRGYGYVGRGRGHNVYHTA
ncbi:hypothetical protein Nepgr_022523 [Nepenthes gracilis]|uniref:Protein decapping 5-like n=1 Tax=Nepenthes gracilis TaxID=150966 RepID=A0AAD3XWW6_NEPGR|nr:hypothetical protein Nepgr_022523 [Nepenthes gracilis]